MQGEGLSRIVLPSVPRIQDSIWERHTEIFLKLKGANIDSIPNILQFLNICQLILIKEIQAWSQYLIHLRFSISLLIIGILFVILSANSKLHLLRAGSFGFRSILIFSFRGRFTTCSYTLALILLLFLRSPLASLILCPFYLFLSHPLKMLLKTFWGGFLFLDLLRFILETLLGNCIFLLWGLSGFLLISHCLIAQPVNQVLSVFFRLNRGCLRSVILHCGTSTFWRRCYEQRRNLYEWFNKYLLASLKSGLFSTVLCTLRRKRVLRLSISTTRGAVVRW